MRNAIAVAGAATDDNPDNPAPNEQEIAQNQQLAASRLVHRLRSALKKVFPPLRDDAAPAGPLMAVDEKTISRQTNSTSLLPHRGVRMAVDAKIAQQIATGTYSGAASVYFHALRGHQSRAYWHDLSLAVVKAIGRLTRVG